MPIDIAGTEAFTDGPYQKPATNDKGQTVFDVLEEFMERMANHSHSGADSREISLNIAKDVSSFQSGVNLLWTLVSTDNYRAELTVAGGALYDQTIRKFYLSDGTEFYPTVERIDATTYYIYSNDNTLNIKVITL